MTLHSNIWKELTSILSNLNNFPSLESCGSRQRDTTSSGWKFRLHNLAVEGIIIIMVSSHIAHIQCSMRFMYHFMFIHVQFQLPLEHIALQPFRLEELIVHIAICVLPGTHLHLSEVQGHIIKRGETWYLSWNPAPSRYPTSTLGCGYIYTGYIK